MKDRYTRLAPSADDESAQLNATAPDGGSGICSDQRVGRDDLVVFSDGLSFTNILLSGSMQWAHDDSLLPVAVPKRVRVERDLPYKPVRIFWTWVSREANPFAGQVADLVTAGCVRALSLSWMPIKYRYNNDRSPPGMDFLEADAIEVSFVPSPALPTALIDAQRSRSMDTRPLAEWAERMLETPSYRAVPRPQLEAIARAAAPARSSRQSTRSERIALARRIAEVGRIQERVARANQINEAHELLGHLGRWDLAAAVCSRDGMPLSADSPPADHVRAASRHVGRALAAHKELAQHHDELGDQVKRLYTLHRRLISAVGKDASDPVNDGLEELGRCARTLREAHGGADDAGNAGGLAVAAADACLVDALEQLPSGSED